MRRSRGATSPATTRYGEVRAVERYLRTHATYRLDSPVPPAGQDAVISASFYGTGGGAELRNVDGSFYDFVAERFRGTARETLARPPDAWGGRALEHWARRLSRGRGFDPEVESAARVAEVVDRIYRQEGVA